MFKLRCYAKKEGDVFVAVCIDLSLAAQGCTIADAIAKLDSQIEFYVIDVFENEREHAEQLLTRKAPWQQVLMYHFISLVNHIHNTKHRFQGYMRSSIPYLNADHSHSH